MEARNDINNNINNDRDKYLDLVRELKKLRNLSMMVIPIVIGELRTSLKALIRGRKS